jgi:poly-gamma-glutamate capsule biosynthesis protein CapA/YwtB (metallophosphatase superfamily)
MLPDTLIPSLPRTDTLSLVMVGDVMLGTNFPSSEYLPPNDDCWPLLEPVANYIQDADISFCNLEGGFGTQGVSKKCRDPKTCYVFRMPDEYSSCLTRAGFDVVSVANNHVNDFGYEGRINTVRILNEAEIHFAGFSDHPYTIFTSNNFLIGFCAFSPNSGVQDLRDIAGAERIVKYLSDTCDIVLVSMHGGAEGANYQHVTRQKETFLGADRGNVYEFAHRMIDSGADVVIGHGPHVTRAMEVYKNRFIAYSLGNFATYARFNLSGPNGIAPLVRLNISPKGEFLDGIIIPIQQTGEGGASPDPEKKIISKLRSLNSLDFPEGQLKLDDSGILRTVISENTETD